MLHGWVESTTYATHPGSSNTMAKETFIQRRKRPISDTCYEHARIIHGSNDFHLLFVARSVTCPPRPIKRAPLVPAAINRHQPSFRIDERCTRVRACVRALIASLSFSRAHISFSLRNSIFVGRRLYERLFSIQPPVPWPATNYSRSAFRPTRLAARYLVDCNGEFAITKPRKAHHARAKIFLA